MAFSIRVNGETREVDVDGDTPMLWVLRDVCGLTGTGRKPAPSTQNAFGELIAAWIEMGAACPAN